MLEPILSGGKTPSLSSLKASFASLVDEGATNSALAVAYTLPEGPSVRVDFIHSFLPCILSTSAVHRTMLPALIFCKSTRHHQQLDNNTS